MSKQLPSKDIVWHQATITRQHREALNNHRSVILWFTGLSGAGKSTLAHATEERLSRMGCRTFVLDGDNVRHGLCADLGFSDQDRMENIRRVGELAKLFIEAGMIVLTAFISPFQADRTRMRSLVNEDDFLEIYCDCSLEVCEKRDVKGFYRRARLGEIKNFTGLSSSYESPVNPELRINTGELSLSASVDQVMELLKAHGII
jgi:adenylylsulfate kinase